MVDEPRIGCQKFLEEEKKIKRITDEINKAKTFGEKAEKAGELVAEVEKLLSCEKYNGKRLDCVNCHRISKLRESTGKFISGPKKAVADITAGLGKPELGLGGIFKGLGGFMNILSGMMKEGVTEIERTGEIKGLDKLGGARGVYGFTVRTMPGGGRSGRRSPLRVERFGNINLGKEGPEIEESREPIVDVFDEKSHVNIIAEIPGVPEDCIKTEVKGDVLIISAEFRDRKYSKEILLPSGINPKTMKSNYKNGILELRFKKVKKRKNG